MCDIKNKLVKPLCVVPQMNIINDLKQNVHSIKLTDVLLQDCIVCVCMCAKNESWAFLFFPTLPFRENPFYF